MGLEKTPISVIKRFAEIMKEFEKNLNFYAIKIRWLDETLTIHPKLYLQNLIPLHGS